jgi:cytochrome b
MLAGANAANEDRLVRQKVWDLPTRVIHWLIVGLTAFCWWSGKHHELEWHRYSGYGVLGLLIFRIYWGFLGSGTARFSHFLRSPAVVLRYGRSLLHKSRDDTFGHNPMGGWSVVALVLVLVVITATGLFSVDVDGIESGPLSDMVSFGFGRSMAAIHHWGVDALLWLVALHLLAIVFYFVRFRSNLIGPMISGNKLVASSDRHVVVRTSIWRVLVGLAVASVVTYALTRGLQW